MPGLGPWTTRVDRRVSGPSAASAAAQVTIFVVDAGVMARSALEAKICSPVTVSITTAPTRPPSALSPRAPVSWRVKVPLVGRGPSPGFTGSRARTGPEVTTGTGEEPSAGDDAVGPVGVDPFVSALRLKSVVIA